MESFLKYLKQLLLILGISFVGEVLKYVLPLPIPASIYGMVLLFVLLLSGKLPLSAVQETGNFLVAIMPVMFIPAGVGLMASWGILRPLLLPVAVITVAVLVVVMAASGLATQQILLHSRKKEGARHE